MSELEHLRSASESIRRFVDNAEADGEAGLRSASEDISRISEQLATVGQMLSDGSLRSNKSDNIDTELQDYRANLERLRATLTVIEERLRSEREILLQKRQHLSAVGRWAANTKGIE
jgi:multidrug resistance efflux pump